MKVFISYSSEDRSKIVSIANDLDYVGHTAWYDQKLSGGEEWWEEILRQIRDCELFIFAMSDASLNSLPCGRELKYASDLKKRIIPLAVDDIDAQSLPSEIARIQIVACKRRDIQSVLDFLRAINLLPSPQPLPNPLPDTPEAPLSELVKLRDEIDNLTSDEIGQKKVLASIEHYLDNRRTRQQAKKLLEKFSTHPKLLQSVAVKTEEMKNRFNERLIAIKPKFETRVLTHPGPVSSAIFWEAENKIITCCSDEGSQVNNTIFIWDTYTGELIKEIKVGIFQRFALIPNTSQILVGGSKVEAWDLNSEQKVTEYAIRFARISCSFDGKYFAASGLFRSIVSIIDTNTGEQIRRLEGHFKPLHHLIFAINNNIATLSEDGHTRLFNLNGKLLAEHDISSTSAAFSYDAKSLVLGRVPSDKVVVLDVLTGDITCKITAPDYVNSVAFFPNSQYIATGSDGKAVTIWDATSGEQLQIFKGPGLSLTSPPGPLSKYWRRGEKRILKSPLHAMGRGFRGGVNA